MLFQIKKNTLDVLLHFYSKQRNYFKYTLKILTVVIGFFYPCFSAQRAHTQSNTHGRHTQHTGSSKQNIATSKNKHHHHGGHILPSAASAIQF